MPAARPLATLVLLAGFTLSPPGPAAAGIPGDVRSDAAEVGRTLPSGAWRIVSAPFRARNLGRTAAVVGALAALSLLDEPIRRNVQLHLSSGDRNRARDFSAVTDPRHDVGAAVTLYGFGLLARLPGVRRAGLHAAEALAVNEAFTVAIKGIAGRDRPFVDGAFRFRPFSGAASFPSGHTTAAFTLAASLSRSAHSRAVSFPCYAIAGSVAAARVAENAHWTTDVVAGGCLGYGIASVFSR